MLKYWKHWAVPGPNAPVFKDLILTCQILQKFVVDFS